MKQICIVQGGPFLLGIDCDNVIARRSWAETAVQVEQEARIFHLAALLSRQTVQAVSGEAICLELRNGQDSVFLVADRITADEAELVNPPDPLPSACPPLTARLCPLVSIWDEMPLLLLEPTQLAPAAAELGEHALLLPPTSAEETGGDQQPEFQEETELEAEEEDDPFFPEMMEEKTEDEPSEAAMLFFPEDASVESAAAEMDAPQQQPTPIQEAQKKESAAIDEETFKQVMSWTIARFKQSSSGEELRLGAEQLPPELASMIRRKGLNKNVIEYLMEQIVLRCKESMSRKKKGSNNAG